MSRTKVLAATAVATFLWAGEAAAAEAPPLAIVGARVFDGDKVLPKATVVVRGGKVVAVGAGVKPPAGATVVDGTGKTLLPGLIDAHTHTFGAAQTDALRFGVTTELDMFAHPSVLKGMAAARESLAATTQADLYSAGILATSPKGHGTEYGFEIPTLTAPDQAEAWVQARIAEGSDYIKIVYEPPIEGRRALPSIDRLILEAVVKAAHAQGRMAVVHISTLKGACESIEAGADGLVHAFADVAAGEDFYRLAAARRVFVVPTLSVIGGIGGSGEGARLAADPRIAPLLSAEQASAMKTSIRSPFYKYPVAQAEVAALKAARVDVLAGTDAGNPTTAHGATLHEEMALLVGAGLTPVEALKAATSTPARRFSLTGRGRIAVGARADLVLVNGDPTTDIEATRAIAGIWKNGFLVERKVAGPPPGRPLAGLLGDFATGLGGPDGTTWDRTSDQLAGGKSEARVSRTPAGALKVEGEIKPPFPFAWGGAMLLLGSSTAARDISGVKDLVFRVRGAGSGPQGRAMLFDVASPQPKQRPFTFSAHWQEVRIPVASFAGLNPKAVIGVVIATDPTPGAFAFEVDDVRLE